LATTNKNFKVKNGLEVAGEIGVGSTPSYGTTGQILSSQGAGNAAAWIDVAPAASYTSVVKHDVRLGEAITKGQAVYVSSSNGSNMVVSKASNTTEGTSSKTLGLLESSGSTNNQRNVISEGLLGGIDVGSASAGDPIWLGTSGNLIYGLTNKPIAPAHLVFIGIVTRSGNNGEIFVRIQNGFELNELHTVLIGTDYTANSIPGDNEFLAYNLATNLWINQTAEEAGVANLSGATFTGNVAGTNISLSGNVNATTVNATTFTGTAAFADTAFSVAISNVSSMGTNVSTFLTTPNSINFLNTITDETGTGNVVFSTSPVLTTPNIGAAIGTSVNVTGNVNAATVNANINANSLTVYSIYDVATNNKIYNSFTDTFGSATGSTIFVGVGSSLTAINATSISSGTIANGRTTASDANGASTIVARNATGNFTANTITANLTGTASSATSAATATSATQVNTIANTTAATFYPTFVDANNGTTAVENVYTGAGLTFNPSTNTLTTTNVTATTLVGNTNAATITGTVANGTTSTAASGVGYMGIPQNIQLLAGNYELVAGDAGKHIYTTVSGNSLVIPANATVAFPIGTTVVVIAGFSTGTILISISSDTLRMSGTGATGTRTLAAYGMATLVKVAATTWFISGNGLT